MLFNSLQFAAFLPVVFVLYWFVTNKNLRLQNGMLLAASYYFYACWDYRFLFLLMFSTLLDYYTGHKIAISTARRQRITWLWISIVVNLGFLGVFKYYNFFATSFAAALANFNVTVDPWTLSVILPVGISFYTFHGLSYVIDIYYGRIRDEKDFIDYALFVSFFPLLVAGPIERATHLLPQIKKPRTFEYARAADGLRQILWGLFKKVVIADNCAEYVNSAFGNVADQKGSTLAVAAVLFAFQIYCDFSGYSDIALGTARLFGIELLRNFAYPYFSRDIAEFWRRWHISLSSWFKDYVYKPLGGSKGGTWMKVRNTFIIFLLSGFWHGANWTFIVWGALNAVYFLPLLLGNRNRANIDIVAQGRLLPGLRDLFNITLTFTLTVFAWIFFRADSLGHAWMIYKGMFSISLVTIPAMPMQIVLLAPFVVSLLLIEWLGRDRSYGIEGLFVNKPVIVRWGFYYSLAMVIFLFGGKEQQFIYFQF
ncbi:MAG TPA: MBOAT family O-acyltransferase [Chryseolinea sp.]|nr:MBOAT family O-acyltransferase [Chryseolinea sp.]